MQTLKFDIEGMSCGGCTGSVQRAVTKLEGVNHVEVTLRPGSAVVQIDPDRVTTAQIEAAITKLGYPAKADTAHADAKAV